MNKKAIISVVAVVLLVAVLATVLVACNMEDYQKRLDKAGYAIVGGKVDSDSIEWALTATKAGSGLSIETVTVTKYKNSDDAKDAYNDAKENLSDGWSVKRHGKVVVFGTKQAVKDAE